MTEKEARKFKKFKWKNVKITATRIDEEGNELDMVIFESFGEEVAMNTLDQSRHLMRLEYAPKMYKLVCIGKSRTIEFVDEHPPSLHTMCSPDCTEFNKVQSPEVPDVIS